MKVKILLILMSSIIFLQSCASSKNMKMEVAAVPSIDQKIGYQETVTSQKKHFVSLAPYSELNVGNKTMFMLSVQNGGEEPISMTYDNILVIFEHGKKGAPMKINIQSPDDFINNFKMESRLIELSFLRSVLKSFKGYLGGLLEQSSRQYSATNYDMEDIHRGVVAPFDAEEKMREFETMRSQNQQIIELLPDFVMTPQVIMPGDSCSGIVVCDTRQMNPTLKGNFKITVSVDGEEHRFTFKRSLLNSKK